MNKQVNSQVKSITMHRYTQMYSEPENQKLDNLKSEPDRSLKRRSENLIAISPLVTKSNNIVCTHYVRVFCILCLCTILLDTSKASVNLTLFWNKSHSVEFLCWNHYLLSGCHEGQKKTFAKLINTHLPKWFTQQVTRLFRFRMRQTACKCIPAVLSLQSRHQFWNSCIQLRHVFWGRN